MSLSLTSWPKGPSWSPLNCQRTHCRFYTSTSLTLLSIINLTITVKEQNGKETTGGTTDGRLATTDDANHVQHDRSCPAEFAGLDADVSGVQPDFTLVTVDIQHQTTNPHRNSPKDPTTSSRQQTWLGLMHAGLAYLQLHCRTPPVPHDQA